MTRTLTAGSLIFACACNAPGVGGAQFADVPPNVHPPGAEIQHDRVVQVTVPAVDVLWTIDNSCSMGDEQQELGDSFPAFSNFFIGSGLDYHIGVISTDDGDNGFLETASIGNQTIRFIDTNTPNADSVFASMASLGTSGSGTERGTGTTYRALELEREGFNQGFYRDTASVHTVVISDEPDQTKESLITLQEFISWYLSLKDDANDLSFSAIVDLTLGSDYITAANSLGGIVHDITSFPWDVVLERLGLQASGLRQEYHLSRQPVESTIEVWIDQDGVDLPRGQFVAGVDWIYSASRNSVQFVEFIPEPLSAVNVEYVVSSGQIVAEAPPAAESPD